MTDKDSNDMTASELLRWAATLDKDRYGQDAPQARLLSALSGKEYYLADYRDYAAALNLVADKIDAELAQARRSGLERAAKSWAKANGWPDFREGEDFGAWLDRCFIPRPRFEDGEPVQIGDKVLCYGDVHTVKRCAVELYGGGCLLLQYIDSPEERVKRPAPEALGADGKPIVAGETVWGILSGIEGIVNSLNDDSTAYVEWDDGRWSPCIDCCNLTHTPPDTQQKIDEDAEKFHCVYFGGYSECGTCPASTGELSKKSCKQQQIFDLLRRQRELDARTGGAE